MSNDLFFVVTKNDSTEYSLHVKKVGDSWTLGVFSEGWKKITSWLPEKISMADNNEYKIFKIGEREFVVYHKDGKPVFHRITGEEYTGDAFCGTLLEMFEAGHRDKEYMQQQKQTE